MDVNAAASVSTAMNAATVSSQVNISVLKSTQNLYASEMTTLMSSLGVGSNVNTSA